MSATNALELGIDVGLLDAVVSVGFPGTVSSLRQQWGRAGPARARARGARGERGRARPVLRARPGGAAAAAGGGGAARPREPARAGRPRALRRVRGAAGRRRPRAARRRGAGAGRRARRSAAHRRGVRLGRQGLPGGPRAAALGEPGRRSRSWTARPARCSAWSSASGAYTTVHEGAIYLHLGEPYVVRVLDEATRTAVVEPFTGNWYTQVKKETATEIAEPLRVERRLRPGARVRAAVGDGAGDRVPAALDPDAGGRSTSIPLDLPPTSFETEGVWFVPEPGSWRASTRCRSCSARCTPPSTRSSRCCRCGRCATAGTSAGSPRTSTRRRGGPTVFVYDGHVGGVGIAERGFEIFEGWVADTERLLAGCPCEKRLPVVRAEPEVREPQRAARQGGGAVAAAADARERADLDSDAWHASVGAPSRPSCSRSLAGCGGGGLSSSDRDSRRGSGIRSSSSARRWSRSMPAPTLRACGGQASSPCRDRRPRSTGPPGTVGRRRTIASRARAVIPRRGSRVPARRPAWPQGGDGDAVAAAELRAENLTSRSYDVAADCIPVSARTLAITQSLTSIEASVARHRIVAPAPLASVPREGAWTRSSIAIARSSSTDFEGGRLHAQGPRLLRRRPRRGQASRCCVRSETSTAAEQAAIVEAERLFNEGAA